MARRDSFISPRVIFSCGFVWNTRKVTQTKRNFEKNKKSERRAERRDRRLLWTVTERKTKPSSFQSWGHELLLLPENIHLRKWNIDLGDLDNAVGLILSSDNRPFFPPMNEKKKISVNVPVLHREQASENMFLGGGSAPTGNDSLSHGRRYFSETLSFNLHSIRALLFGFSTFIRQQILRLSRLFRGNSPGTLSWTSNIPPTSYICTVCGVYKDSWHSWLVRQPFQNLKKKKKKGTETSVSWFARGLDELCCRWPLRVIHGFHRTSDWRNRCCFFLPGLWRNTWCEERP